MSKKAIEAARQKKEIEDRVAAQRADAPVFDIKDFVQVSHSNLQVEDETEEVPGSGVFTKGWRYASIHRDKTSPNRVVLFYGKYEYEGMDVGVTYTLTMEGGKGASASMLDASASSTPPGQPGPLVFRPTFRSEDRGGLGDSLAAGALLSVCWQNGRIANYPLYFPSIQGEHNKPPFAPGQ